MTEWTNPLPDSHGPCCPACATRDVYAPMKLDGHSWRCEDCGHTQAAHYEIERDVYEWQLVEEAAAQEAARAEWEADAGWRIPQGKPRSHGGSSGRRRKRVPKADERIAPRAEDGPRKPRPGECVVCLREIPRRNTYCPEHAAMIERERHAREERERRARRRAVGES